MCCQRPSLKKIHIRPGNNHGGIAEKFNQDIGHLAYVLCAQYFRIQRVSELEVGTKIEAESFEAP